MLDLRLNHASTICLLSIILIYFDIQLRKILSYNNRGNVFFLFAQREDVFIKFSLKYEFYKWVINTSFLQCMYLYFGVRTII